MDKDFVRDQNPTPLYYIYQQDYLPDYVKEAAFMEEEHVRELHDIAFADKVNRLHPIHSKTAAYLSGIYLAGHGENSGPVWEAVKQACEYYGVEDDLEQAVTALMADPDYTKEASEETEKWAVHVQWNEEEVGSYYPINTPEEVKIAGVNLDQDYNRGKMPVEIFRAGAKNIMKEAHEQGVPLNSIPKSVQENGTERLPNLDYADLMLYTRKEAGVPEEGMEIYKRCIKIAKEAGTDEAVETAVSIWRDLDTVHDIDYLKQANGERVPSPQECFYTGMTVDELRKTAQEHVVLKGIMIPHVDFAQGLDSNFDVIDREFSKEAAEEIKGVLKIAYTLEDNGMTCNFHNGEVINMNAALEDLEDWQQNRLLHIVSQN